MNNHTDYYRRLAEQGGPEFAAAWERLTQPPPPPDPRAPLHTPNRYRTLSEFGLRLWELMWILLSTLGWLLLLGYISPPWRWWNEL